MKKANEQLNKISGKLTDLSLRAILFRNLFKGDTKTYEDLNRLAYDINQISFEIDKIIQDL